MKRFFTLMIIMLCNFSLCAMEKATKRKPTPRGTDPYIQNVAPSLFLVWFQDINRALVTKSEELQREQKKSNCLSYSGEKIERLRRDIDELRMQKLHAQGRIREIKDNLRLDEFYSVLESKCGRMIFFTGPFEDFPEGECFSTVLSVLQYHEIRHAAVDLAEEVDEKECKKLVRQIDGLARQLLTKTVRRSPAQKS